MLTFEERTELLKQGRWTKCRREGCSNPARWNELPSFCSRSCIAKYNQPKLIAARRRVIAQDPEHWRNLFRMDAEQRAMLSKILTALYKTRRGPRIFSMTEEFIVSSHTITLGRHRQKALDTGHFYSSPKGTFKTRTYKKREIPYRNEWDLKVFKSLDENPLIESWIFLGRAFPYKAILEEKRDIPRHIVIDFEVKYRDGSKRFIFLRPNGLWLGEFAALRTVEDYCLKENIAVEVWTAEYFATSSGQSLMQ